MGLFVILFAGVHTAWDLWGLLADLALSKVSFTTNCTHGLEILRKDMENDMHVYMQFDFAISNSIPRHEYSFCVIMSSLS